MIKQLLLYPSEKVQFEYNPSLKICIEDYLKQEIKIININNQKYILLDRFRLQAVRCTIFSRSNDHLNQLQNQNIKIITYLEVLDVVILLQVQNQMQNYQLFWNNQINTVTQLVIDWDVFILNFATSIAKYTQYQLNDTQKSFIKTKIDPENRNQIYKSAFLLFAKSYWDIPSNRTNLFKMKMNLSKVLPRFNLMTNLSSQKVTLTLRHQHLQKKITTFKYLYENKSLFQINGNEFQKHQKKLRNREFIKIGSEQSNDIVMKDCIFVNKTHLKLISVSKQMKSDQKRNFFEDSQETISYNEWYLRDISKSNRLRFLLDRSQKYVFAKPLMVLTIGLTQDIEIKIKKIGSSSEDIFISKQQEAQVISLLNFDRINFMGQIDQTIPLKTALMMNNKSITSQEIEQMYKEGLYYPQSLQISSKVKNDANSINFTIFNKRTFSQQNFTCFGSNFCIGRAKDCTYRLDDIGIRNKQLKFECINNIWLINNPQPFGKDELEIGIPSVYLASSKAIQENLDSNRVQLKEGYPYRLRGKEFQIEIQLNQPIKDEDY